MFRGQYQLRIAGFFAFLFACLLASTCLPSPSVSDVTNARPAAFDRARRILFSAGEGGTVRILNLANNIGEIATLRAQERHAVYDMKLDDSGRWLWVLADSGIYRYDARTFRLTTHEPRTGNRGLRFARVEPDRYRLQPETIQSPAA